MKYVRTLRLLLACCLIVPLVSGRGSGVAARPDGPDSTGAAPTAAPRNVAFGKPVFLSTNGALAPLPGRPAAHLNTPAITDGNLKLPPTDATRPAGIELLYNPTWGGTQAVTITIDLQGAYKISSIRYHPGQGMPAARPDTITTPLGSGPARPTDSAGWTTHSGQITADTIVITLHKTRRVVDTGMLAIGEIEVYGIATFPNETLKLPFDPGHEWRITQGYHGDTSHNQWEQAYVCGQDYLSFDLARVDFRTEEDRVRASAAGRVWVIWPALGAVMIRHDWAGGVYFTSYLHMDPINPDLRLGQWVPQGAVLGRPGAQGLVAGAGVHIHWSLYRAPDPALVPAPRAGERTPNWCRDPVRWAASVPFLQVEAAGRGLLDFTDEPDFGEPCGCEGMYAEKRYFSTQYEIGLVPAVADVPLPVGADGTNLIPTGNGGPAATGHTLAAPFQAFWTTHGGEDVLGAPVTEAYWERDAGGVHQAQGFERAVVRRYPAATGRPGEWRLDPLGTQMYGGYHRTAGWLPVEPFETTERQRYFPETGHGTYGAFYRHWQATGGRDWWGYPISEPFYEANTLGQTYLTQYFERARLEYHPENQGTPAEIRPNRLGLLGLIAKGWVAP